MKIYLNKNVFDAALERMRWVFDNFPNVVVSSSGGKDSDVVLRLALMVAKEKNRLPLRVCWLDQEIEWQMVADHVKSIMYQDDVDPLWLQMPFVISNATSAETPFLDCWAEDKKSEWIREKDPISVHENKYNETRFHKMFEAVAKVEYPNEPMCYVAGVRGEESPTRQTALTSAETYKGVTWGKTLNKARCHYTFYPIYDWSYTDVWKAIHDNKWKYCKIYDYFYQYGVPTREMRVSNLNHETAVKSLYIAHELEPETWSKVSRRLNGTNTAKVLQDDMLKVPKQLPFMFKSWQEYRDYLVDVLYEDEKKKDTFKKKFKQLDEKYIRMAHKDELYRVCISSLLANDYEFVLTGNWESRPDINSLRNFWKGRYHKNNEKNKYIDWSKENADSTEA